MALQALFTVVESFQLSARNDVVDFLASLAQLPPAIFLQALVRGVCNANRPPPPPSPGKPWEAEEGPFGPVRITLEAETMEEAGQIALDRSASLGEAEEEVPQKESRIEIAGCS